MKPLTKQATPHKPISAAMAIPALNVNRETSLPALTSVGNRNLVSVFAVIASSSGLIEETLSYHCHLLECMPHAN